MKTTYERTDFSSGGWMITEPQRRTCYYPNGNKYWESHYTKKVKDGNEMGYTRFWYESGALRQLTYFKFGKVVGPVKTYYETGELHKKTIYERKDCVAGPILDETIYEKNGAVIEVRNGG
jgi:antitoxin component YwqK of YwqJK toxin-antitoxin module